MYAKELHSFMLAINRDCCFSLCPGNRAARTSHYGGRHNYHLCTAKQVAMWTTGLEDQAQPGSIKLLPPYIGLFS